ncbi:MAG TPA: DUF58 domain-containing protein, partial [Candidatus Thermoplasmatota archaeon]|nr:DUF58 domain-containing protein [Candidatus Thermoplasmatota archaeon]
MLRPHYTQYAKTLLFLSILLFITSFLFTTLLPAFTAMLLIVFMVYTKTHFKPNPDQLIIQRRIMEPLVFSHHPINIKTTVKNTGPLSHLAITDELPQNAELLKGQNTTQHLVKHDDEVTLEYQIQFLSRGQQQFNDVSFEFSDPWGLYNSKTTQPNIFTVMVHSDPKEIQKAKRVSNREHIELSTPVLGGLETLYEMDGIRPYEPGDRLKDIDWKTTSRLQKHMTKIFQKQDMIETTILLDCSRSMRRTSGKSSKVEHATTLAVHLSKILQSLRHPVGLVAYDEFKTLTMIEPTNNYTKFFESLSSIPEQIHTKEYSLEPLLETEENTVHVREEHQQFLSTVFPFLTKGKRTIHHPAQASGIYEAVHHLLLNKTTKKHLIVITDLETDLTSLY